MNLLVAFDQGYQNLTKRVRDLERPALWHVQGDDESVYSIPFPRNPSDFNEVGHLLKGKMPLPDATDFERLPRFGLSGMTLVDGTVYAGSWNALYQIDPQTFRVLGIISHPLVCDAHGIAGDERFLVSVLTCKDTVVLTDFEGNVIDYFTIMQDLTVMKESGIEEVDWRFVSKQYRGSCGFWHFNFVQLFGDEVWLTSRNASCFVILNLKTLKVHLRLINHRTPNLIHDGKKKGKRYYFTSVDGKVIIAENSEFSEMLTDSDEQYLDNINLYHRDLVQKTIRLDDSSSLGREPNWCRGIEVVNDIIYVTIDGAYGSELSFGLLGILESGKVVFEKRLNWSDFGDENELRYMSGFDVMNLDKNKENC